MKLSAQNMKQVRLNHIFAFEDTRSFKKYPSLM